MKKTFRFLSVVLLSTLTGVSAWATTYVIPTPTFSELTSGDTCYLYNIGQKMFFNKGEAYGTQAVVDHTYSGALLIIANKQADDTYKIFTGAKNALKPESNSVLFRVASENAAGPKATFADGNVDDGTSLIWVTTCTPFKHRLLLLQQAMNTWLPNSSAFNSTMLPTLLRKNKRVLLMVCTTI